MSPTIIRWIERAGRITGGASKYISVLIMLIFTVFMIASVFFRYVLNQPIQASDEILRYFLSAVTFLSLAYITQKKEHVRVTIFLERLSPSLQRKFDRLASLFAIIWVSLFTYGAWNIWIKLFNEKITSHGVLEVQLWIPGLAFVLGMFLFLFQSIITACKDFLEGG